MCQVFNLFRVLRNQTEPNLSDDRTGQQVSDKHGDTEPFADDPGNQSHGQDDEQIIDEFDHGVFSCGGSFRLGNGDYTKSSWRADSEIATTAGCFSLRSIEIA